MEGGNGVREANVVTLCSKRAYQIDAAEKLPRMDSALGVLLDGESRQEKAEASKNLFHRIAAPTRWIAAVSAAKEASRKVRKVREVLKITLRSLRSLRLNTRQTKKREFPPALAFITFASLTPTGLHPWLA